MLDIHVDYLGTVYSEDKSTQQIDWISSFYVQRLLSSLSINI